MGWERGGESVQCDSLSSGRVAFAGDSSGLEQLVGFGAHEAVRGARRFHDGVRRTPLLVACIYGHTNCVRLLLAAGAPINEDASDGASPLLVAAQEGHAACVQLLCNGGALLGQAMATGEFPLLIAASRNHEECVQASLTLALPLTSRSPGQATPLSSSQASRGMRASCGISSPREPRSVFPSTMVARHSLSRACSVAPSACGSFSRRRPPSTSPSTVVQPRCAVPASKGTARACGSCSTPTRMSKAAVRATAALPASQEGHHECVEMLIGAGAAVDIASSDGTSALFMTCQPGHTRSAELLLEGGASASLAGHEDGSTPLHAASEGGHLPCVLLLLAAGANPLQPMRGPGRLTPLAFAARYGHPRCVLALREAATQSCACGGGVHGCDELA